MSPTPHISTDRDAMNNDATPNYFPHFHEIFRPELNAAEARRRRYRIEQLIGFLPEAKGSPPAPAWADESIQGSAHKTLPDVKYLQRDAEKARETFEQLSKQPLMGRSASQTPCNSSAIQDAAKRYFETTRLWYEAALVYRSTIREPSGSSIAKDISKDIAKREQAESILRNAAHELSDATHHARREGVLIRPSGPPSAAARVGTDKEIRDVLGRSYGLVLSCELEVQVWLEKAGFSNVTPINDCEAAEVKEGLCRSRYRLARAEQLLFEAASELLQDNSRATDCAAAKYAVDEDVQRWRHRWDKARRALLAASSSNPHSQIDGVSQSPSTSSPSESGPSTTSQQPPPPETTATPSGPRTTDSDSKLSNVRERALELDLVGLALSGGGIRSATFNLGVLQGLAQLRLLGTIDYLSTVSGGGYIGSWFAAWVRREHSLENVEKQLSPSRVSQAGARRFEHDGNALPLNEPRDHEPEPIHHLRSYSRYLSPRLGLFSADTWTLFTIYLRNVFVNALFFVPVTLLVVFLWRVPLHGFSLELSQGAAIEGWRSVLTWQFLLTAIFGLSFWLAAGVFVNETEGLFDADISKELRNQPCTSPWIIIVLLLVAAITGVIIFRPCINDNDHLRFFGEYELSQWLSGWSKVATFTVAFAFLSMPPSLTVRICRWWRRCRAIHQGGFRFLNWHGFFTDILLAGFFGLILYQGLAWRMSADDPIDYCLLYSISVPIFFGAMVLAGFCEMAFVGRLVSEYEREWRSRLAAYLLMTALSWLIAAAAILGIPYLLTHYLGDYVDSPVATKTFLASAWAAISAAGAWLAKESLPSVVTNRAKWIIRLVLDVAPLIFLTGLCAGVSMLGQELVNYFDAVFKQANESIPKGYFQQVVNHPKTTVFVMVGCAIVTLLLNFLTPVNRFSLHMLYANRLTRCYLGASARKRTGGSRGTPAGVPTDEPLRLANLFTGFDPWDDLSLTDLLIVGGDGKYTGPAVLINTSLNCLAGDELAYQDRRAEAFSMSPNWCGSTLTGFARTPCDNQQEPLTLGRAMTISGAAVDPNMSQLSAPLTALMTLFNTRLGWWLQNPNPERRPLQFGAVRPWTASEPGAGSWLLGELFGRTNENSSYVHLSDGGHFENLGVYELIRRRCRFIIVADAGTDCVAASDNMAAMLRIVRSDFGVRIELDASRMQIAGERGLSAWHCCVGRIRYDEVDQRAAPGLLVYLQATLTGDEPPDLIQYVARHPRFPRQSTLNQFFDEAQFEAYRILGHHVAIQVFGASAAAWSRLAKSPDEHQREVRDLFARLRRQWQPVLEPASTEWVAVNNSAMKLERHVSKLPGFRTRRVDTYPELDPKDLSDFEAVSQTLQVMEQAWWAMRLDTSHSHPGNRGWMNTFRRWTASRHFHRFWPVLRGEYGRAFVAFCENILNLEAAFAVHEPLSFPYSDSINEDMMRMNDQFTFEWSERFEALELPTDAFPRSSFISNTLGDAVSAPDFLRLASTGSGDEYSRLSWLIRQRTSDGPSKFSIGIACVARTKRLEAIENLPQHTSDQAEFFFWLRGPFRSVGLGQLAGELLREIDLRVPMIDPNDCGAHHPIRQLVTYFPLRSAVEGNSSEMSLWMDFFFDLGFRRVRQPVRGPGANFIILKRPVGS